MVVKPHKSHNREKKSTSANWSVCKQPGWESCATSLRYCEVISHKKKKKKKRTNIDSLDSTVNMTFIDGLNS